MAAKLQEDHNACSLALGLKRYYPQRANLARQKAEYCYDSPKGTKEISGFMAKSLPGETIDAWLYCKEHGINDGKKAKDKKNGVFWTDQEDKFGNIIVTASEEDKEKDRNFKLFKSAKNQLDYQWKKLLDTMYGVDEKRQLDDTNRKRSAAGEAEWGSAKKGKVSDDDDDDDGDDDDGDDDDDNDDDLKPLNEFKMSVDSEHQFEKTVLPSTLKEALKPGGVIDKRCAKLIDDGFSGELFF